jgi:hypothetical protein
MLSAFPGQHTCRVVNYHLETGELPLLACELPQQWPVRIRSGVGEGVPLCVDDASFHQRPFLPRQALPPLPLSL